jgi:hypothetical protein
MFGQGFAQLKQLFAIPAIFKARDKLGLRR